MSQTWIGLLLIVLFISLPTYSKTKVLRKSQEVNFSEVDIEGKVRNPDGAYLVQKKGIKFVPLYETRERMDKRLKESKHILR